MISGTQAKNIYGLPSWEKIINFRSQFSLAISTQETFLGPSLVKVRTVY